MTRITDLAIVLRAWPFSETSQTVALFCRDHGMVRGLAKGAHRPKAPFSGGFEPLTTGEIVAILRDGAGLATLTEWDLRDVCWAARRDLDAHRIALYASEAVYHAVTDRDPHPALFDALSDCLAGLTGPDGRDAALLAFQWALLVETGYQPRLDAPEGQAEVLGFSPALGAVVTDPASDTPAATPHVQGPTWRVRAETIDALKHAPMILSTPEQQHPRPAVLRRANRLLASYLAWLLDRELPAARALFGPLETERSR